VQSRAHSAARKVERQSSVEKGRRRRARGERRLGRTLLKSTDVTLMNNFLPKNRFERLPPESRFRHPRAAPRLVHLETFKRIRPAAAAEKSAHDNIKYIYVHHIKTTAAPRLMALCKNIAVEF